MDCRFGGAGLGPWFRRRGCEPAAGRFPGTENPGGREKEARMICQRVLRVVTIGVLALFVAVGATGSGWAAQATPTPAGAGDSPGLTAMAAAAGTVGSFFYIPFKLGAICPGMAVASGVSLAVTGGDADTAAYLLRAGCAGTYFITPGMVRGQREFRGSGAR